MEMEELEKAVIKKMAGLKLMIDHINSYFVDIPNVSLVVAEGILK